jgi:c(7)-type cytochrome triheme protein
LSKRFGTICIITLCLVCFLAFGLALAQAKKVGGGDIKFVPKGADPVLFSHATHVTDHKLKCTDCHTKIFKMKKEDLKMTKDAHGQDKNCGVCHNGKKELNGKKVFSQNSEADCAKCHKK